MNGACSLCRNERELKASHILPEFMYQNIYDSDPKRFYQLSVDLDDKGASKSRIMQKGVRENLLCSECEVTLSKYEKYAAETIYAKNKRNSTYITHQRRTDDGSMSLYDYAGFSYPDFKIFLLSILWRIIISKSYETPAIDERIIERLRVALLNEDPLEYDDFGCLLQAITDRDGKIVGKLILQPYMTGTDGTDVLNILVDGLLFSFYLDSKKLPEGRKEPFLKPDGTMQIIGRWLIKDDYLVATLKAAYEFFDKIKKI